LSSSIRVGGWASIVGTWKIAAALPADSCSSEHSHGERLFAPNSAMRFMTLSASSADHVNDFNLSAECFHFAACDVAQNWSPAGRAKHPHGAVNAIGRERKQRLTRIVAFRISPGNNEVTNCAICDGVLDQLVDSDIFGFGLANDTQFGRAMLRESLGQFGAGEAGDGDRTTFAFAKLAIFAGHWRPEVRSDFELAA